MTAEQLATDQKMLAFDRTIQHLNRRGFLGAMLGAAAVSGLTSSVAGAQTTTAPTVVDVLNFALNLEYLEANFYLYASTGAGRTLSGSDVAVEGAPPKLPLDPATMAVCEALALDETNHIMDLQGAISTLGGTPIAQPLINFAAHGAVTTQAQFLMAARQFTALGGSAYVGGAQLLVSNPTVLTTAGQILGAEGQHAGVLAYLCVNQGVVSPAIDMQDVPPSQTNYFTVAPTTALSPSRNTSQVLGVAYGVSTPTTLTPTTGTTMGGFFPSGFNGTITST